MDYATMTWERVNPDDIGAIYVHRVDSTGVPGLVNAVILETASIIYSIEPAANGGLEVYRAQKNTAQHSGQL